VRFITPPRRAYHRHYNVICNPLLWFLCHQTWSPAHTPNIDADVEDAWERGYVPVNRAFADEVVAVAARGGDRPPLVMFRDYHLLLAPAMVREALPGALLHFRLDVPWPGVSWWSLLPGPWRTSVFSSLLANDVIGFPSARDRSNFAHCTREFAGGAESDERTWQVNLAGKTVRLRVYPPGFNPEPLKRVAGSQRVQEAARELAQTAAGHTFVRVERAEPHKNIVRTVRAFSHLLHSRPELKGRVRLLLVLAPASQHIAPYRRYTEEIQQAVDAANSAHRVEGWEPGPVELHLENNYPKAIAALTLYDTLVVTPVADATSPAAREGPVVNRRNGLLILSDAAGLWERMREHSLNVGMADVRGLAKVMAQAVDMPQEERAKRAAALRDAALAEDATSVAAAMLADLMDLA
jgi:trehalose 6-phosphate synthase